MEYGHDALRRFKELVATDEVLIKRWITVRNSDGKDIVEGTYGLVIALDPHNSDFSKVDIM